MNIIDRLLQFIEIQNISINKFAQKIDVSNAYFAKQKKNNANIGSQIIEKIVREYKDLNLEWLITGEGTMLKTHITEPFEKQEEPQTKSNFGEVIERNEKMIKLLEEQVSFLKKQLEVCQNDKMFLQKNFQSVKTRYD